MTREEAVNRFIGYCKNCNLEPSKVDYRTDESANIGTEVNDLISRADAIEAWDKLSKRGRTEFDQVLMTLPSADRPQGEWEERYIEDDECVWTRHRFYCSVCGNWNTYGKSDYCPKCGARMVME